jgi:hypothetical protein
MLDISIFDDPSLEASDCIPTDDLMLSRQSCIDVALTKYAPLCDYLEGQVNDLVDAKLTPLSILGFLFL